MNDELKGLEPTGETITITLSPEMRAALIAVNEASKEEARRDEQRALQIKPLTITYTVNYLRTWGEMTSIICQRHLTTDEHYYFVARDRIQEDWARIEVKVERKGYMVEGTRYHDIWKRPVVKPGEFGSEWDMIDSLSVEDDE